MELLKGILYFSVFNHPLKKEEVFVFSKYCCKNKFNEELSIALQKKIIIEKDGYYSVPSDINFASKREMGNLIAKKALNIAHKKAKFISTYFPYIEAVGISGSLSKGYFDENSDIDFFIITKPNRLWFCRTVLILYKKIFLFNSRKFFCMNYFISSDQLEIEEKNRFTATELVTLLPLYGKNVFEDFYRANLWTNDYFPNKEMNVLETKKAQKSFLVKFFEKIFNNQLGILINRFCFNLTYNYWKKKYKNTLGNHFDLTFKSTQKVSKHHPLNFQNKVITALNTKYDFINKKYNLSLIKEDV